MISQRGYLGTVFTPEPNGRVSVRPRLDDLARFSPQTARWLPSLRAMIDRHAVTVQLRVTEGYILDNRRWLHGRRAFSGNRVLYRVTNHYAITPRPSKFTHQQVHVCVRGPRSALRASPVGA